MSYYIQPIQMSKIIFLILLTCGYLVFNPRCSLAQVATLSSQRVVSSMPVFAKIDTLVQSEQQKYVQDFSKKRYRTQILLGVADSLRRSSNIGLARADTMAYESQLDLEAYERDANKKVSDYKEVLIRPYLDQINAAIKIVSQRLKYKMVIDIQQVPLLFIDPVIDITDAVIKELNKK